MDVTVSRRDLTWTVRALIDTGAPVTIFDRGVGDALDIDFSAPADLDAHYIGGKERWSQPETVTMQLGPFHDLSWDARVGFLREDWNMPFSGILGHDGFLDRWVVSFHAGANYFVVEEPESFEGRLPPNVEAEYERRDLGFRGP